MLYFQRVNNNTKTHKNNYKRTKEGGRYDKK